MIESLEAALEHESAGAAVAICQRRIEQQPDDADAHRHLAQLLSAAGEKVAAQRSGMRACELAPHDPRCWSDLGRVHARADELELAIPCFMEAVGIDARHADGWHNLGHALARLGRDESAFTALKNALHIDPSRATSWIALGELLLERKQDEEALHCFDRAAANDPGLARARSRLGEYFLEHRRVPRAETLFRQSLAIDPQHLEGWIGLARTLEDLGDFDAARQAYLQALQRRPTQGLALSNYISLLRGRDDVDDGAATQRLADAQAALTREETPHEARALIGYALAKHHDRRGEHRQAAKAGIIANNARRSAHGALDREQLKARVDGLIANYDSEFFATRRRHGLGNDQPVFIVGLPRSGTTLTEQVLAAHPRLHGAGELPDLAQLALRVLGEGDKVWQSALKLDEADSRKFAQEYLQALHSGAPKQRRRITDKAPLNFFHLAFAAVLFPGARVIHCQRDVRDNALSIWLENFNADQHYATDFDDLGSFVAQYRRLMAHWHAVLPLALIKIQYEETVADLEAQARRLMEFVEVPWDARCLDFHRSSRAVQTPSRWQVRQPIYTRSVGRWRAYEQLLPALTELGREPTAPAAPASEAAS